MESFNKNVTPGGILTSAIIGSVAPVIPQTIVHVTPAVSHGIMCSEGEEQHGLAPVSSIVQDFSVIANIED